MSIITHSKTRSEQPYDLVTSPVMINGSPLEDC